MISFGSLLQTTSKQRQKPESEMLNIAYTRIHLQQYERAWRLRMAALPVIRARETALRTEIARRIQQLERDFERLNTLEVWMADYAGLWMEVAAPLFQQHTWTTKSIRFAGVNLPVLHELKVERKQANSQSTKAEVMAHMGSEPAWRLAIEDDALEWLRQSISVDVQQEALRLLNRERRKATQKLNLFEKIQIPALESAIKSVRRFLEDEDNLVKATLKRVKSRRIEE